MNPNILEVEDDGANSGLVGDPMAALLSQAMPDDPRMQLLMRMCAMGNANTQDTPDLRVAFDEAEERHRTEVTKLGNTVGALRQRGERMVAKIKELRNIVVELALAVGACPNCWGASDDCPLCAGRGQPGFLPPDPDLYEAIIVPAIRRMRGSGDAGSRVKHVAPAMAEGEISSTTKGDEPWKG